METVTKRPDAKKAFRNAVLIMGLLFLLRQAVYRPGYREDIWIVTYLVPLVALGYWLTSYLILKTFSPLPRTIHFLNVAFFVPLAVLVVSSFFNIIAIIEPTDPAKLNGRYHERVQHFIYGVDILFHIAFIVVMATVIVRYSLKPDPFGILPDGSEEVKQ